MKIVQELGKSTLILNDSVDERINYMKRMIIDNSIDGLLECSQGLYENSEVLKYDVTNMISARKKFDAGTMNDEVLSDFLLDISGAIKKGRQFLLEEDYFVIDPDYIFFDMISNDLNLLYVPVGRSVEGKDRSSYFLLADFLLETIDHSCTKAVDIAYSFYKMSKEDLFSLDSFCNLFCKSKSDDKENTGTNKKKHNEVHEGDDIAQADIQKTVREIEPDKYVISWRKPILLAVATFIILAVSIGVLKNNPYSVYLMYLAIVLSVFCLMLVISNLVKKILNSRNDNLQTEINVNVEDFWYDDGDTRFFDEEMTVFFDENAPQNMSTKISWDSNGEKRTEEIFKFPCIIGKKYDEVDVCIGDDSVSRIHASIIMKNKELYVKDLGSTNGTFVSGNRLLKNEEVRIGNNGQISFGKVDAYVV